MGIYEDSRQHEGKHETKHGWWASHGVPVTVRKLDYGDYMTDYDILSIDTKEHMAEIAGNICGRGHDRFRRECERAQRAATEAGIESALTVLVENDEGIRTVGDVRGWVNTTCVHCRAMRDGRCDPVGKPPVRCNHGFRTRMTMSPVQGERLERAMRTMQDRYAVRFMFCKPGDSARIICDLLGVRYE